MDEAICAIGKGGGAMSKESRTAAQDRYDRKNTKQYHLKLNLRTDSDIIEKLDTVGSKQGYIKRLIREDMR